MARTRQTVRMSTGGLAPRRGLAQWANCKTAPAVQTWAANPPPDLVYPVSRIDNRRDREGREPLYRTIWHMATGPQPCTRKPRSVFDGRGFEDHLAAVDQWINGGRQEDFEAFAKREFPAVLTNDPSGTCLFKATKRVLTLLDEDPSIIKECMKTFDERLLKNGVDIRSGMTWKVFRAFVRLLVESGPLVDFKLMDKNLQTSGHRRVQAIENLRLANGFYVGAMKSVRVGHAFVLFTVKGKLMVADQTPFKPLADFGE